MFELNTKSLTSHPQETSVELSEKEYRGLPLESFSSIKHLLGKDGKDEGPGLFLRLKGKPFTGNNNTLLGTAIHNYLQGNRHLVAFNIYNRTSKVGKEAYAKFETEFRELAGEEGIIVPKSFEETLSLVLANYNSNPKALHAVEGGEFEVPLYATINGVTLKGRVDAIKKSTTMMTEIKSSSQAFTLEEFRAEAEERFYHVQAALYLEAYRQTHGLKLKHCFVVANTREPYAVKYYPSGVDFLKRGEELLHDAIEYYKKYIINGEEYIEPEEHL